MDGLEKFCTGCNEIGKNLIRINPNCYNNVLGCMLERVHASQELAIFYFIAEEQCSIINNMGEDLEDSDEAVFHANRGINNLLKRLIHDLQQYKELSQKSVINNIEQSEKIRKETIKFVNLIDEFVVWLQKRNINN